MKLITIIIIVIASLFLLLVISLLILNHFIMKYFKNRNDKDTRYKYLSLKDFPGLRQENVSTTSVYKAKINGGIFSYPKDKYGGVIIFYHGYLSGYLNYLMVINHFAKAGFIVVAFDMYGNMSSEGKNQKGFPLGDKDNKVIIDFVKNHPVLNKYPLFTMGHSWGGHSALTSLIHDDLKIKKSVAITPYNSNVDVNYSTNAKLKIVAPLIYLLNLFKFGHESTYSGVSAIRYTTADVLILCGEKDNIVKPQFAYKKFVKCKNKEKLDNVTIKLFPDRGHFIYLSKRGEEYFNKEIAFPRSKPIDFDHLDHSLVNELNVDLLNEIVDFLKK